MEQDSANCTFKMVANGRFGGFYNRDIVCSARASEIEKQIVLINTAKGSSSFTFRRVTERRLEGTASIAGFEYEIYLEKAP